MKIGLVIYGSLDTVSGGYLYDRKLVEYLQKRGETVEVFSIPWRNYARHLADNFSPGLRRRLADLDVDALLQDELNHPSLFLLNKWLKPKVSYPIVSIVHHLRSSEARAGWLNSLYRQVESEYLSGVDGFIFNSATTQRVVRTLTGRDLPSVVARPAGDRFHRLISESKIKNRAHQSGPLKIFFLGNVIPRKGLHTLLNALHHLKPDTWRLTVTGSLDGDRAYAKKMVDHVRKAGWDQNVVFTGTLELGPLAEVMSNSQVLAMPSLYEGFGIAYLEGMAFGLPAIGSTAGAAKELIAHGENGYLIQPEDHISLVRHLLSLSENRGLLVEISLNAQKHFLAHPGWEESMSKVHEFLGQTARNNSISV